MSYANPAAYERFMGRWSARLAPAFLRFAQVKEGQHIVDVGCGTGVLSRAVISSGADRESHWRRPLGRLPGVRCASLAG